MTTTTGKPDAGNIFDAIFKTPFENIAHHLEQIGAVLERAGHESGAQRMTGKYLGVEAGGAGLSPLRAVSVREGRRCKPPLCAAGQCRGRLGSSSL